MASRKLQASFFVSFVGLIAVAFQSYAFPHLWEEGIFYETMIPQYVE